jgi:hypothetical protein
MRIYVNFAPGWMNAESSGMAALHQGAVRPLREAQPAACTTQLQARLLGPQKAGNCPTMWHHSLRVPIGPTGLIPSAIGFNSDYEFAALKIQSVNADIYIH